MTPRKKLCPECRGEGGYCDTCDGSGWVKIGQHYDSSASVAAGGISEFSSGRYNLDTSESERLRRDPLNLHSEKFTDEEE